MKKLLHKSSAWLMMLIAMFAVSFSASAQDVTITPGYNASTMTSGDVTVSGTGGYQSGYGYLVQGGQNMVVTSSGKAIVKIVVTEKNGYCSYGSWDILPVNTSSVAYKSPTLTWEGNAQSVTFSNTTDPNDWDMYSVSQVEVWFEGGAVTPDPGTGGETPDPGTGGGTVTPDPGTGGGSTTGAGGVLNFDFSAAGNGTLTQSPVTVTYSRGSEGGKSVASLSMWNDPLVFTSTGANIVKIELTGVNLDKLTASGYTNPVWEGNAKSVTFSFTGAPFDYAYVTNAAVTLEGTAEPTLYQYRVAFEGYPDGTVPSLTYGGNTYYQGDVLELADEWVDSGLITVSPIDGYMHNIHVIQPGDDNNGSITVTFRESGKPNFPAEGVAYQLQIVDDYLSSPLYLNLQQSVAEAAILGNKPEAIYFTWDDTKKAFTIKDKDGNFAGVSNSSLYIGSTTPEYWVVELDGNAYRFKCSEGYLGCNNVAAGKAFFRNKAVAQADKFVITEYVEQQIEYTYFTIPDEAFHKSSIEMDLGNGQTSSQLTFTLYASEISGVEKFEPIAGNGKSVSATLKAGIQSRNVNLTFSSYDGSYISISNLPSNVTDGQTAFTITFPQGAFVTANGDVSGEFTFTYTPGVVRKTYTINLYDGYSASTPVKAPADVYVVYANEPNGTQYKDGSSYSTTSEVSEYDFACPLKYWEIDREHSRVGESTIFLYLNRLPYTYHVSIEGCENATVTVKGEQYGDGDEFTSTDLLTESDVVFDNNVRGYTLQKQNYTAPAGDEDGYITAQYEAIQYTYATLNTGRTSPAPGSYSLDDRAYGFQYFNVYFDETMSEDVSIAKADLASAGITLRDAEGHDIEFGGNGVNAWADGQYFSFSAKEAITTPGTYTLHVPAGTFFFGKTVTNPELDLVWTLTAAEHYTVEYSGVKTLGERMDAANEWSALKNLSGFEITAPEGVTFKSVDGVKLYLAPEGNGMMGEVTDEADLTEATGYSISFGTTQQTILVSFDPVLAPAAATSYSFVIPAGSIASTDGLTNKQINLSAHVDPTVYFDLVVTYPAEGNAQAPVDHITVELPEGVQVNGIDGYMLFNGYQAQAGEYTYTQDGRELTITFADHAAQAGDYASYFISGGVITGVMGETSMANSSAQQYNIPVTAAPVEYLVEFAGWPFDTHDPQVTYNNEQYAGQKHIIATDLTVEQLQATPAEGYGYVITIDQPGYVQSHGFGRVLVTYTAKAYAAVSSVSPAEGEISLDNNADGLTSITIFMDGEAGWDADVYAGDGNPVPAGVKLLDPNGDEVTINDSYGFCMWQGSTQININHTPYGLKTPGTYTLIIPAGLNTIGGKENPRMEYTWTVKEATTFEFDRWTVEAIGTRNNDGVQLSLTGFTVALPENLSDISTEVPGLVDLYITVSTGDEMSEEPAEPTRVSSTYSITDGVVTFTFPEAYTEKGRVSVTLNANNIGINGLSNKAFSTSFYVDPNPTQYISLETATPEEMGTAFNEITEYSVTSSSNLWAGIVLDITAEMLADKTITVSYYTQEEGSVEKAATVESVSEANGVVTFQFTEPVTIPFDAWYSVIFPEGFITFEADNIQSYSARFNNHKLVESYMYNVIYDETVPAGARLLQNGNDIPPATEGSSYGGIEPAKAADFTATPVAGMQPVVTVVQPTREQPIGTVTLSYETIEPVPFNGQYTINGTPSNLGEGFLSSISSFTIPAPEGHTFASADDCVLRIMRNLDTDYAPYESVAATISEDGSEVTITLQPAYSTPAFNTSFVLDDNSLILDNGAPYVGFNCSVTLFPEYAFNFDHTDPADRAVIYNGDLDHIDVYLPAGLNVGYNTGFGIEIVGTDYKESFQPSYISNFGDFYRIQLPTGMDLPYGRLTVTIPSDVFYYYDYENNNRYVTNAPYPLWIDNFSALQLVADPAAGTVVGLDAIRVQGERGTRWSADTDVETLAQRITFGTYEGPVAVNTALENGVLVITPVETLAEGYYTLTIDGLAGVLESADVAASVNAPARFEFNVVGSTFAFQGAQPNDGKTISELTELETINLSFGWNVGNVRVSEQAGNAPILVTLTDGDGTEQTVIQTYPAVSESEWGGSVAQLVGTVQDVDFASTADGKYNVSLTIPAGIFVSDNGRTNEAMTLHYVYDSNKYFAVSPNFESWGNVAGPVKTFTLTAAEGVTFTGIAPDKVDDPENGVDRPTIFKNGSYLTWANPVISADGKSVTLTLAEPISADSPYDQYFLVVPDGLFTGTVTTEEGVTFPATSTGFGAWQQAFYVTAPAYEYAQINWGDEMQSGDSYAGKASNFQIHFGKSVYCNSEVPAGAVLTDDQGTSYALTSMWSSDDYLFLSSDEISAPGHYTLILPAGAGWFSESEYTQEVRFEFNIVGSFAITDGTFSPADNAKVDAPFVSFTYTLPEGKTVQSVDVTKIGTSELNNDTWQWEFTPFAGLTYEISGEKSQVVFTFAQPYTETGRVAIKVLDGLIVATDGSVSTTNPSPQSTFSVQVIKYTYNDITEDGVNDKEDAIAISDIILQVEENDTKADVNGDGEVTIGDLVKYIQHLQSVTTPAE